MNEIDFIDFDEPTLSFGAALKQGVIITLFISNLYRTKINLISKELYQNNLFQIQIMSVTLQKKSLL